MSVGRDQDDYENTETGDDHSTALELATMTGNIENAQYLIENNADVNMQDKEGWTALHYASLSGNLEFAQFLLENGADPKLENKNEKKSLDFAIMRNHPKVADLIKSYMK